MPVYNEEQTPSAIIEAVLREPLVAELICVDDCSVDGAVSVLERPALDPRVRILRHAVNRGKGAALRTGFAQVTAPIVIVQDADLEYPAEYPRLTAPILEGRADVVFGSRFVGSGRAPRSLLLALHRQQTPDARSNIFTNLNLTDMETLLQDLRREVIQAITLEEDRFGIEPDYRQGRAPKRPFMKWPFSLPWPDLRRRKEDRRVGWRQGDVVHPQIQSLPMRSTAPTPESFALSA
jgi:glycosyltransferase involved in cell wall biosynthesis